jgi:hypothetical protein
MDKSKDLIVVGTTSKLGNFIFKYPARAMIIILLFGETAEFMVGVNLRQLVMILFILLSVFLPLLLLVYLAGNKWCYKIEIDKSNNTIIFYRLFNRGVHTFKIDGIKIIIKSYCHIFIGGSEFILHADFIHDLVSHLPKDTVIEYKGPLGKYKEHHWEKGPLIPGNRF